MWWEPDQQKRREQTKPTAHCRSRGADGAPIMAPGAPDTKTPWGVEMHSAMTYMPRDMTIMEYPDTTILSAYPDCIAVVHKFFCSCVLRPFITCVSGYTVVRLNVGSDFM